MGRVIAPREEADAPRGSWVVRVDDAANVDARRRMVARLDATESPE